MYHSEDDRKPDASVGTRCRNGYLATFNLLCGVCRQSNTSRVHVRFSVEAAFEKKETKMKDFLGNELNFGDKIVACVAHGKNSGASLVKGRVTGFTKQYLKAEVPSYNYQQSPVEERRICPSKVIKILP